MKLSRTLSRSVMLAASLLTFAGCATAPAAKDDSTKADEYVWVTPLGSNIPVKVKKGDAAATASPTNSMSGDQAANALHSGGGQMTPPRGAGGP